MAEQWIRGWDRMVAAIGRDFGADRPSIFGEPIELTALKRYLEPLEFDCALHYDATAARQHGYADVVVPFTALASFAMPLMWTPGEALFAEAGRDVQPLHTHVAGIFSGLEPPTAKFLAVSSDADFIKPALLGDRLCRRGAKLLGCTPKETKLGRGAFVIWQTEIVNQRFECLARLSTTFFRYNPHRGETR
ncbi:MAG: FAS1-like dehydratase domain-containing protein [Janthinobacterium lividum]